MNRVRLFDRSSTLKIEELICTELRNLLIECVIVTHNMQQGGCGCLIQTAFFQGRGRRSCTGKVGLSRSEFDERRKESSISRCQTKPPRTTSLAG